MVLVGQADALDEAMDAEAFKAPGYPCRLLAIDEATEILVAKTIDGELAMRDRREDEVIFFRKEVETSVVSPVFFGRP